MRLRVARAGPPGGWRPPPTPTAGACLDCLVTINVPRATSIVTKLRMGVVGRLAGRWDFRP